MTTIKARFDGSVFVPEEPVDLPLGNYKMDVEPESACETGNGAEEEGSVKKTFLQELAEELAAFPDDPDWPPDMAQEHDHYLYGTPKNS